MGICRIHQEKTSAAVPHGRSGAFISPCRNEEDEEPSSCCRPPDKRQQHISYEGSAPARSAASLFVLPFPASRTRLHRVTVLSGEPQCRTRMIAVGRRSPTTCPISPRKEAGRAERRLTRGELHSAPHTVTLSLSGLRPVRPPARPPGVQRRTAAPPRHSNFPGEGRSAHPGSSVPLGLPPLRYRRRGKGASSRSALAREHGIPGSKPSLESKAGQVPLTALRIAAWPSPVTQAAARPHPRLGPAASG
jgi:hypothetical protein